MDWIAAGDLDGDDGVTRLVVGRQGSLGFRENQTAALDAKHHLVLGVFEVGHVDQGLIAPRREYRSLIDQVSQVGTGHTGSALGDCVEPNITGQRNLPGMHPQNSFPAPHIGSIHHDLPIEPAGTEKRRIEHVRAVRGRDENHSIVGLEPVHLHQQLIQGLLPLVVPASESGTAVPSNRIDLVDEDDARSMRLALLEQVADPAGTDTDEHLDEV